MALKYPPAVGSILVCEFPPCFSPPEMVKTRPVVVLSPKITGRPDLATVVPLSTTAPSQIESHHCKVPARMLPKSLQATAGDRWAKCDMVYTLHVSRLSPVKGKRDRVTGKRDYEHAKVDLATLQELRRCAAAGLGIGVDLWPQAANSATQTIDPEGETGDDRSAA
ncbi:type II toxin-antitoxin system PemK/MazF family toxin [Arenimonas caeni]|uniref:Type II toxin-antitoxin system PemK/MazF family toxin n=1 Tax=Arenimonas caeni TaxID=2058085 RepID=A0A2P6M676_9GAMM|nr:type II toxin-antitoxin system PemK/MazF family toxin [Arenimonas caeni]PRH81511.1 hypothetical protein C6N40_11885 [Arenimonas caeni]